MKSNLLSYGRIQENIILQKVLLYIIINKWSRSVELSISTVTLKIASHDHHHYGNDDASLKSKPMAFSNGRRRINSQIIIVMKYVIWLNLLFQKLIIFIGRRRKMMFATLFGKEVTDSDFKTLSVTSLPGIFYGRGRKMMFATLFGTTY